MSYLMISTHYVYSCLTLKKLVDLDECTTSSPCGSGSTCTNTVGGYKCDCPVGREYDYQNNVCTGKLKIEHKNSLKFITF